MPATYYSRNNPSGILELVRRCPRCGQVFPADPRYFYQRGDRRFEYCTDRGNDCHGEYHRQRRRRLSVSAAAPRSASVAPPIIDPARRKFGVELEGTYPGEWPNPISRVTSAFTRAGLRVGYSYDAGEWAVGGEHWQYAIEMRTPPLTEFAQVYTGCGVARDLGIRPTIDCGLHVHLDASDMTLTRLKHLVRDWAANERHIKTMVSPSRRNRSWCADIPRTVVERVQQLPDSTDKLEWSRFSRCLTDSRYQSLNLHAFNSHGTIECRLHQGSHNPDKIRWWVEFLRGFLHASITGHLADREFSSAVELVEQIGRTSSRVDPEYTRQRVQVLASVNELTTLTA